VGFQEATELQLEQLIHDHPEYAVVPGPVSGETRLPAWMRSGSGGRERVQDAGEWCPLFYRRDLFEVATHGAFWLSPTADEPGSVLPGTWLPRVVNWARFTPREDGRAAISIFNTHIDFLPWATRRSARILWERLQQHRDGMEAQVVMGDFNAAPGSAIHRCLLRDCAHGGGGHGGPPAFQDAWEIAAHREGPEETFHAGRGRRRWPGRIDHIFFRPATLHVGRCVTITHGLNGRFPSDHYPVMAEFRRRLHPHPPADTRP
jgi:endonuclease/exonuclease/phosphatase family metal-dependent hydrolase